jgi:CDP-glucose 4,6-dehydratase
MLSSVYYGKTVLVTGHTGFKGSWLSMWLTRLGAKVVGISLGEVSVPSNFGVSKLDEAIESHFVDVRDATTIEGIVKRTQPDFIFHLAAQALVRPSYESPLETFSVNAMGSANVLNAVRSLSKFVTVVMITSDKAYDNVEWVWGYKESDKLGGKDPYSASKGMAELAIRSFIESYFRDDDCNVRVGITRAGNVIGGGDWAVDRIVPDCMQAWAKGESVDMRSPKATRPWQHVLEPLSGYLRLGATLYSDAEQHGEAFNFGPHAQQNHSVSELIDEMAIYWDNVRWKDSSKDQQYHYEAGLLKLNCDKSLHCLQWLPTMHFEETVRMTVQWYKHYYQNTEVSMMEFTLGQIEEYENLAKERKLEWALA